MGAATHRNGAKPTIQNVLRDWERLNEDEKVIVLPRLLRSTQQWQSWAFSEHTCLVWLRRSFRKAGVPFLTPER